MQSFRISQGSLMPHYNVEEKKRGQATFLTAFVASSSPQHRREIVRQVRENSSLPLSFSMRAPQAKQPRRPELRIQRIPELP